MDMDMDMDMDNLPMNTYPSSHAISDLVYSKLVEPHMYLLLFIYFFFKNQVT